MVEQFDYDKLSGIDLAERKDQSNPKSWRPIVEKREGKWSDIRTVYSGIGQDTVVITPISHLRAIASVGVHGKMYVPHFMKEFKPVSPVGEEATQITFRDERASHFTSEAKPIPMTPRSKKKSS
jgi:cell division protein FtsI/penicillin-binding protein 2